MNRPAPAAETPEHALRLLREGNARFAAGEPERRPLSPSGVELAAGQSPFAVVLGCSDSRVPIESIFDQSTGRLFVVRLAGNFIDDNGLGSIEYSVSVLGSSLVVVLGHTLCGAVDATLRYLRDGTPLAGHMQGLVAAIEPAARDAKRLRGDWYGNAIAENVRRNVAAATVRSSIVAGAVEAGTLSVVGGVYELHSGRVNSLAEPSPPQHS